MVCSKCSETRKLIASIDSKSKVRVCDECEGIDRKKMKKGKSSKNLLSKLMSRKPSASDKMWYYLDDEGEERGPCSSADILNWFNLHYMGPGNKVRLDTKGSTYRFLRDVVDEMDTERKSQDMDERTWMFLDDRGAEQGPYTKREMVAWFRAGYFEKTRQVKCADDEHYVAIGDSMLLA